MTPAKGQTVTLYLRYGIQVEGVVKEWDENQIVLTSGIHHLVIYNPSEDLIMAKIMGKSRLSGIIPKPGPITLAEQVRHTNEIPKPIENTIEVIDKPIASDYPGSIQDRPSRNSIEAIEDDIAETIASPSGNSLRIKKLATLRGMLNQAEKEVIANKLTSHQIAPQVKPLYGQQVSLFKRNT